MDKYSGSNPVKIGRRLIHIYFEDGFVGVKNSTEDYLKHNTFFLSRDYKDVRKDISFRWGFISEHICESDQTLLDIGCAEGYYCNKASKVGLNTIGIDVNKNRISEAQKQFPKGDFRHKQLDPNNIFELPSSDITLFLTVHHHWVKQFGWEKSKIMVKSLMKSCRVLIYEPPGDRYIHPNISDELEPIEYYREVIFDISAQANIIKETYTEYGSGDRTDPMYAIDCSKIV